MKFEVFESPDNSEQRDRIYEDLQNIFITETGDLVAWLNSGGDQLPRVFEEYTRENPNFIDDWDDVGKREALIAELRTRIKNRLQEEEDKYAQAA